MKRLAVLAMLLMLALVGCRQEADLLLGPYVNRVTDSQATVLWVTQEGAPPTGFSLETQDGSLPFVVTGAAPISEGVSAVLHTATLTGLMAGRTYDYAIADGRGETRGSFFTAPPKGSRKPFKFIVYGDTRSFPDRHSAVIRAIQRDLPAAFFVNTGDLVADGRVWPLWQKEFFGPARDVLRRAPFWPVRGNHEEDAVMYRRLFDLPETKLYYSFDFGNLHFVVLDSRLDERYADPAMLAWLERDLAATKADWIIVAYHRPSFDVVEYRTTWGNSDVMPILEKYGVDLVLSGHSHVYERFRPIGPAGGKPIIHIITGGGGAPNYDLSPSPIVEKTASVLHYCVFRIAGDHLEMVAKTPDGKVLDRLKLVKRAGQYQPEVMARALTTERAQNLAFVVGGFYAAFPELPKAGQETVLEISPYTFAEGTTVEFSTSPGSPWIVKPQTFRFLGNRTDWGRMSLEREPYRLTLAAPADLTHRDDSFNHPLTLRLVSSFEGRTYTRDDAPIALKEETRRMMMPEPRPVDVPRAPAAIAVDGDLADWNAVPYLFLPSRGAAGRTARLAWSPAGLYAAFDVTDAELKVDPKNPLGGDCVEVFLEGDNARRFNAALNPSAFKCEVFPLPAAGPGLAGTRISYGRFMDTPAVVQAAWGKTDRGYALEVLIPADVLDPGKMEAGAKIGFHYILHGAKSPEQFVNTKGKTGVWRTPIYWGVLRLVG